MLQSEWEFITNITPTPEQWAVITEVYTFHPAIPDVGGKKVLADLYKVGGFGLIASMHSAAKKAQEFDDLVLYADIELQKMDNEKKAMLLDFANKEAMVRAGMQQAKIERATFTQSFKA